MKNATGKLGTGYFTFQFKVWDN